MSFYPMTVKRCEHSKVNGTQCGSPALRDSKLCYYHVRCHWPELDALPDNNEWRKTLPTLEDANSIQVALANVMERLIMLEIDHKTAALMLYALQTASMNLKRTSLEPALPTQVVIDRESVATVRLAPRRGPGSRDASTTTLAVTIRTKRAIVSN